MKIGFVVDGQAEFRALPALLKRIETSHILLDPLYADIQPFAPVPQIVGTVKSKLPILKARGVHRVVVLIDKEVQNICPGQHASAIARLAQDRCKGFGLQGITVVVKDTCFENWLVADTSVFAKMPKRFELTNSHMRSIQPNKADRVDAQRILQAATIGASYSKITDAVRIMTLADAVNIAANSRSFRKFMREVGNSNYLQQSREPYC